MVLKLPRLLGREGEWWTKRFSQPGDSVRKCSALVSMQFAVPSAMNTTSIALRVILQRCFKKTLMAGVVLI